MHNWQNIGDLKQRSFKCKFCDKDVASRGAYWRSEINWQIYICPNCARPTFFEAGNQIPAPLLGYKVEELPDRIATLYNEIRDCTGINAFTSAVLSCRKLLMNIAVEHGAEEGKSFIEYVEYLSAKGFVPPHGKEWVDHIRKKGNEAAHEIVLMEKNDALDLINFIEMLLKFIYEFPKRLKK
jgi:hypothetical protein